MRTAGELMERIYAAFNRRDVDGALAWMTEDVDWPKASEGGRVVGKGEIRSYWTRQWEEFDPHVEPLEVKEREPGEVEVRVHQMVRSLGGEVLWDGEVRHVFQLRDGLVARMDLEGGETGQNPGTAFGREEG